MKANYWFLPAILLLIALSVGAAVLGIKRAEASAPSGLPATVATTSRLTVGATALTAFATSTSCAARTIGTTGAPIMVTFTDNDGQTPSATLGFPQAASTTVTYDSGQVGCGALKVYSFIASTITVSEAR